MPKLDAENELEGNVGYLTFCEFQRFTRAWENAYTHVSWWRVAGYIKLGDRDEHRTRGSELPLGVPSTWLAAEEISRLMGGLNGWRQLEDAVNDQWGAELALLFTREVETAMAKWPVEDRPHDVRYFGCTACQQQRLRYYPPKYIGGRLLDLVVKCTEPSCRAVMDGTMYERMALMIKWENDRIERLRRLDSDSRRARSGVADGADGVPVGSQGIGADAEAGEGAVAVSTGSAESGG